MHCGTLALYQSLQVFYICCHRHLDLVGSLPPRSRFFPKVLRDYAPPMTMPPSAHLQLKERTEVGIAPVIQGNESGLIRENASADEVVIARFGKRQQLRVRSLNPG